MDAILKSIFRTLQALDERLQRVEAIAQDISDYQRKIVREEKGASVQQALENGTMISTVEGKDTVVSRIQTAKGWISLTLKNNDMSEAADFVSGFYEENGSGRRYPLAINADNQLDFEDDRPTVDGF